MGRIVALATLLFLVPVLLLGTISPQVIRLVITDVDHAGRVAGRVYAWSTAGAIVGTFATGWLLISWLGVFRLIFIAGVTLLGLAIVVGFWRRWAPMAIGSAVAAAAVLGLVTTGQVTSRCTMETNYFCIRVYDDALKDDGVRVLVLDHLIHSFVKLDDPGYLGYGHEKVQVELTHHVAATPPAPKVLLIGGGGYTYPRWVEAFVPTAAIDVVEIDPGVTETAYLHLGLARDTRIRSFNLDGRQYVHELAPKGSYNIVVQDAVNDLSVPYHIMTREYNDDIRDVMTPDGIYLLSVIDLYAEGQLLRAALRTMRETFPHVHLLAEQPSWRSGGGASVFVIYGSNRPLDLEAVARTWATRGGAGSAIAVLPDAELDAYLAAGPPIILTDQYAPVDNLISILFRRRFG
jgi:spermidine synthase